MHVWINGQFVDRNDARVSAFDAGLQHGVGLFETMIAQGARVHRLSAHLDRLAHSAKTLRLTDVLRTAPLADAVRHTLARSGLAKARIRLTLTGGDLNLLQSRGKSPSSPTIIIAAQPATEYPDEFFDRGVMVTIADGRLNPLDPFAGHKTLHYWPRLRALQDATRTGASESLWLTISNHLAAGSVSNIFIARNDSLATPIARGEEFEDAVASPVLPGIVRASVIDYAEDMSIDTARSMLTINDLLDADEVLLTNSSWGVLPVVTIEGRAIADGKPGELARSLRARWLKDLAESSDFNDMTSDDVGDDDENDDDNSSLDFDDDGKSDSITGLKNSADNNHAHNDDDDDRE